MELIANQVAAKVALLRQAIASLKTALAEYEAELARMLSFVERAPVMAVSGE